MPLVWVRQKPNELPVGFCAEVGIGDEWLGLGAEPINAAGGGVDLALVMLAVRDVALVKIGDEQRAVGGVGHVNRPEGDVGIFHREANVARDERCAAHAAFAQHQVTMQRVGAEEFALPCVRHGGAVDGDDVVGETRDFTAGHHRQFAECERIVWRPKLARAFTLLEVEATLHVMKTARAAAVVTGKQPADSIELQPKHVAAAFGENLELARLRAVTPNHAAFEVNPRCAQRIDAGPGDAATHRAALRAVQPAVRPPSEAVGH